jgi:transcription antitermination protein NusB
VAKGKPIISRRQIRGKVLQAIYAWYTSENRPEDVFAHLLKEDYDKLRAGTTLSDLDSDAYFLRELYYAAVANREDYDKLIEPHLENWDWQRVAMVDRVVLLLAIVEPIHFPAIPTRVTLNEALELAKTFSTEKSNQFVNGILDTLLVQLKAEGRIQKTGKGLLDYSKAKD